MNSCSINKYDPVEEANFNGDSGIDLVQRVAYTASLGDDGKTVGGRREE